MGLCFQTIVAASHTLQRHKELSSTGSVVCHLLDNGTSASTASMRDILTVGVKAAALQAWPDQAATLRVPYVAVVTAAETRWHVHSCQRSAGGTLLSQLPLSLTSCWASPLDSHSYSHRLAQLKRQLATHHQLHLARHCSKQQCQPHPQLLPQQARRVTLMCAVTVPLLLLPQEAHWLGQGLLQLPVLQVS